MYSMIYIFQGQDQFLQTMDRCYHSSYQGKKKISVKSFGKALLLVGLASLKWKAQIWKHHISHIFENEYIGLSYERTISAKIWKY